MSALSLIKYNLMALTDNTETKCLNEVSKRDQRLSEPKYVGVELWAENMSPGTKNAGHE